ncbi:anti-sigma factor [Streptomyces sp. R11]|uniref:Anti-sigma factor n=1 Tax=Streptomyces sp. R11 TaxID=3238625 RepID=A0AB39NCG8_9ACTN
MDGEVDLLTDGPIDEILRQEAVWVVVPDGIEQRVMHELMRGAGNVVPMRPRLRRRSTISRRRIGLVAASVALLGLTAAVGSVVLDTDEESQRMQLTASASAAGHADVTLRDTPSGVAIEADFQAIPPAPEGSYYEGWVTGERGAVAIGTFHLRDGQSDVTLWAGVELADYPRMTVTLQKEGGGPASSGNIVLSGDVPDKSR